MRAAALAAALAVALALPPTAAADGRHGPATWFRAPAGTAAAGPALRRYLGHWRGRRVRVCRLSTGRCTTVRLTDWCRCPGGRLIDLSASSFRRLAPLSRGVIRVSVARG